MVSDFFYPSSIAFLVILGEDSLPKSFGANRMTLINIKHENMTPGFYALIIIARPLFK